MEKVPQRIVAAAVMYDNFIAVGVRHYDTLMQSQMEANLDVAIPGIEGFVDNRGTFYDRKEAMVIVKRSGQDFYKDRNGNQDNELYSEGVW